MSSWKNKILALFVILLFTFGIGLYTGIKNSSDYQIAEFTFDEINDTVKVYRDENFVPTIIAKNTFDLFFAQGYEMARDRLWQMEFYKSVAMGELSNLFGEALIGTDKYLKTLSMELAADAMLDKMSQEYLDIIDAFVQGLNKYIELHLNNLPTEFTLLGVEPRKWTIKDPLLMQGVLSQTLSFSAMNKEFTRNAMAAKLGPELGEAAFPFEYDPAEEYYLDLTEDDLAPVESMTIDVEGIDFLIDLNGFGGSNNWVVGPENSSTGNALLANDPHLGLSTPGIFWQNHLVSPDYHVQGVSLPGVPGIIIGHNEDVSWGVTNSGIDALDVFYFKTNDQNQYWYNNTWTEFGERTHNILGETFTVKTTVYGPVMDPEVFNIVENVENYVYTFRWTLLENYERDQIFKSILDLNRAENYEDIREALRYFGIPGQNFVFATVDGNIGYQQTGIIPNRTIDGAGIIPQNGSDTSFGWNGIVPYESQYFVLDPDVGYFATANAKIDNRDLFYQADNFALPYRQERIETLLSQKSEFSIQDMKNFQNDAYNLYAKYLLDFVKKEITDPAYNQEYGQKFAFAKSSIINWDLRMVRGSAAPTIFSVFRIFFEELTFKDELDANDISYQIFSTYADHGMASIVDEPNNVWFDRVDTEEVETRADIVRMAFEKSIIYITEEISSRTINWDYEKTHEVVFEHPMGESLGILNEGGIGSDGSEHTLKAAGSPDYDEGVPVLTQTWGAAVRMVVDVEPSWSKTYSIVPPGQSEHFFVSHRDDMVKAWVNGGYYLQNFGISYERDPDFTYIKV